MATLDETCAIRVENELSRKIPPVYVNGQPIGSRSIASPRPHPNGQP